MFQLDSKGARVCESSRSRQELSNEYLDFRNYMNLIFNLFAKIVFDTAENGPLKVRQKLAKLKVTN